MSPTASAANAAYWVQLE